MNIEIVALNDRKFVVKRVIMATDTMADNLKQQWGCDIVLHKQGKHYLCEEIVDVEWEDTTLDAGVSVLTGVELDNKGHNRPDNA